MKYTSPAAGAPAWIIMKNDRRMSYLGLAMPLTPPEPSFRLGRICFGGSGGFPTFTETIFPSADADGKLGSLRSSSTCLSGGGSSAVFPPKKYKSRKTPRHTASATTLQWILMVEKFSVRKATHLKWPLRDPNEWLECVSTALPCSLRSHCEEEPSLKLSLAQRPSTNSLSRGRRGFVALP